MGGARGPGDSLVLVGSYGSGGNSAAGTSGTAGGTAAGVGGASGVESTNGSVTSRSPVTS